MDFGVATCSNSGLLFILASCVICFRLAFVRLAAFFHFALLLLLRTSGQDSMGMLGVFVLLILCTEECYRLKKISYVGVFWGRLCIP